CRGAVPLCGAPARTTRMERGTLSVRTSKTLVLVAGPLRRAARRRSNAARVEQHAGVVCAGDRERLALAHARPRPGARLRVLLRCADAAAVDELRAYRPYPRRDALHVSARSGPRTLARAHSAAREACLAPGSRPRRSRRGVVARTTPRVRGVVECDE